MRTEYSLGEDVFLALATFFVAGAVILKVFNASFMLGLAEVKSLHFLKLGVIALLFNMALNLQDIARKK